MIRHLHDRCHIRYVGFCDAFDYWEPPAGWIYACLLALVAGAVMLLPSGAVGIVVLIAGAAALLFAAIVPCWITALAVWEAVIEWGADRASASRRIRRQVNLQR